MAQNYKCSYVIPKLFLIFVLRPERKTDVRHRTMLKSNIIVMKHIFIRIMLFLGLCAAVSSCGCSGQKDGKKQKEEMSFDPNTLPAEPVFDIVTNMGTIRVKLYSQTPLHRDNFVKLASEGFYDGILFHRVINGFMIQTGDPLTKDPSQADMYGTGGPGYTIPAEFVSGLTHKKGALAAARRGDAANPKKESSGSQFYIVQDAVTCAQLDGDYTVFGETIEGFDVIDKIAAVQTDRRDRPVNPVKITTIRPVLPEGAAQEAVSDTAAQDAADTTAADTAESK